MSLPHHDDIWDYAMNMEDPFSAAANDNNDDFLLIDDDMDMDHDPSEMGLLDNHPLSSSASFDLQLPEDSAYPTTPPTFKNSYLGELPPMPSMPSMVSPNSSESSKHSISEDELREQYNCTLQKLADSMRRSEATRFELLRQSPTSTDDKNPSDVFMSTESRSQLWTFIHAHHNNPQEIC
jgi:hypothetical protein